MKRAYNTDLKKIQHIWYHQENSPKSDLNTWAWVVSYIKGEKDTIGWQIKKEEGTTDILDSKFKLMCFVCSCGIQFDNWYSPAISYQRWKYSK